MKAVATDLLIQHIEVDFPPSRRYRIYIADAPSGARVGTAMLDDLEKVWCTVWGVYVVEAARRMKVGTRLMTNVIDDAVALGKRSLYLTVRKDNEAAQSLYRSLGFKEFCESGEHDIGMGLVLSSGGLLSERGGA